MIDYFKKFISLPQELRDIVSSSESMKIITALEKEYGVPLAQTAMKVMTKDLPVAGLAGYFQNEFKLEAIRAGKLAQELTIKIFQPARDYLGIGASGRSDKRKINETLNTSTAGGFFFSPEDEKDIDRHASKISGFGDYQKANGNVDNEADKVAEDFLINFSSTEIQERFKKIIRTYIRNIREKIDTIQALKKPISAGGVGLDEKEADKVISAIDAVKQKRENRNFTPPEKIKISADDEKINSNFNKNKSNVIRDVDYNFAALKNKKLDPSHELAPPPPAIRKEEKTLDHINIHAGSAEDKEPSPIFEKTKKRNKPTLIRNNSSQGKKQMHDVKRMPLIMSPIDELKYLSLDSFRRLSSSQKTAQEKILENIGLLAQEGFDKKAEGIQAWRQSPIYKMYLSLGEESVSQKQPINAIIEKRMRTGEKVMTAEEFKEIMKINRTLNY